MIRANLDKLILKWLDRLMIKDYTVSYAIEKPTEQQIDETVHKTENACVLVIPGKRSAKITFNSDSFSGMDDSVVLHEGIHILMSDISSFVNTLRISKKKKRQYDKLEEEVVEHFTKVLYKKR